MLSNIRIKPETRKVLEFFLLTPADTLQLENRVSPTSSSVCRCWSWKTLWRKSRSFSLQSVKAWISSKLSNTWDTAPVRDTRTQLAMSHGSLPCPIKCLEGKFEHAPHSNTQSSVFLKALNTQWQPLLNVIQQVQRVTSERGQVEHSQTTLEYLRSAANSPSRSEAVVETDRETHQQLLNGNRF